MLQVTDVLRLNRRRYAGDIAVVDERGRATYAQLVDRAWGLARALHERGVRPGDTVGVLTGNSIFSVETYLGIVAAGAVAVPYNWRWSTPELVFGINDSCAAVVLVEADWTDAFAAARATGELERVETMLLQGDDYERALVAGGPPDVAVGPDDGNVILYTGGTTGFPKGVLLTHRNVMANAFNEIIDTDMERSDRTLLITPMFHSASLLCWFLPHLVLGARSVLMRTFDEELVGATIARERVTNGFLVPNMVRRLLNGGHFARHDMSSYRRMYVGGATFRMPDKLAVGEVLPGVRLYYQYGLTEAGPIVTRLRPEDMYRNDLDGSIGREFLLTETRVVDAGDVELPPGGVGELCVRGPNVMAGYYRNAAATDEVLRDGWLHTGDVVSRDADGYLYFHDRLKDMIKSGGENVYSAEVERVLYAHPGVAEAAVLGVPSTEWDEEVRAVVALRPGATATEDDLREHCRRDLAGYKVPKRIAFIALEEMPVNASGKLLKTELRQRPLWSGTN
jgi:acyl-CoA synthetase (AMP-forming)/AMP-acid ligase II